MASDDNPEDYKLPEKYEKIPLCGLNSSARRRMAMHLNLDGTLNDSDLMNNYKGLAELIGFEWKEIENFDRQKSPTEEMLAEWTQRLDPEPTVGNLWNFLQELERFDVLLDAASSVRMYTIYKYTNILSTLKASNIYYYCK